MRNLCSFCWIYGLVRFAKKSASKLRRVKEMSWSMCFWSPPALMDWRIYFRAQMRKMSWSHFTRAAILHDILRPFFVELNLCKGDCSTPTEWKYETTERQVCKSLKSIEMGWTEIIMVFKWKWIVIIKKAISPSILNTYVGSPLVLSWPVPPCNHACMHTFNISEGYITYVISPL